ncbi:MAG TPA: glycoside hydrolase family 27 protein [Terriglobales bacterium]|nr:glycoside hydrolase family 27 protein [Terriglobales bacterium]
MRKGIQATALGTVLLLAPMLVGARQAGGLSGTWKGEQHFQRGARSITLTTTYVLKASGGHFTGLVLLRSDRREVVGGTIANGQLQFGLRNPFVPESKPQPYRGTLSGDTLTVEPVRAPGGRGGRGPQALALHKISNDTVYHLPPGMEHPPLPPLRTLPPNGLALTPPMGWNSWNKFHGSVNDQDVRATADLLVATGMRDAGYVYVNIDDTWEGTRDAAGNIQPNAKFPDMKALADYVHSKGLKLGIYSSPGPKTCAGYEGSYNHEAQDAHTYAAWGVDYLKYDWCSASLVYGPSEMEQAYEKMALALRATGRPMVFSLCEYGWWNVGTWGAEVGGNLWRTTDDINDSYARMAHIGFGQMGREGEAGPGHWNDPDMLEIGNGGMSNTEYRTHMSLWAMLAAPLLAGNDLTKMTPAIHDLLTNREVIAVDQDKLGRQGVRVGPAGDQEVWRRTLAGGATAVALFNRGTAPASMTVRWQDLGLPKNPQVRDLWAHKNLSAPGGYTATVAGHGVAMLRVR